MNHIMKLQSKYFNYILSGTKRIELRLYDEKRQKINIGDIITFVNESNKSESFDCQVINLLKYNSFEELINEFDISLLADKSITKRELLDILNTFYSKEKQLKYGVVGIEIQILRR